MSVLPTRRKTVEPSFLILAGYCRFDEAASSNPGLVNSAYNLGKVVNDGMSDFFPHKDMTLSRELHTFRPELNQMITERI